MGPPSKSVWVHIYDTHTDLCRLHSNWATLYADRRTKQNQPPFRQIRTVHASPHRGAQGGNGWRLQAIMQWVTAYGRGG